MEKCKCPKVVTMMADPTTKEVMESAIFVTLPSICSSTTTRPALTVLFHTALIAKIYTPALSVTRVKAIIWMQVSASSVTTLKTCLLIAVINARLANLKDALTVKI